MLLASVALLAAALVATLLRHTAHEVARTEVVLLDARAAELRYRAWSAERGRFLASRSAMADASAGTAEAVQLGSAIAQAGHQAIAEIPFALFDAIPGTREGSKRAREVHDNIAGAVYGGIAAATGGFSRLSRRMLTGDGAPPTVEGGSALPELPTPPESRPD